MSQRTSDVTSATRTFEVDISDEPRIEGQAANSKDAITERNSFTNQLRAVPSESSMLEGDQLLTADEKLNGSDALSFSRITERIAKVEKQNRRMKFSIHALFLLAGYLAFVQVVPTDVIIKQTLMESEEVKLIDKSGNTRFFLRMYSRVPVLQLLDSNGKPRMSLGLRFDDTPFLDLSDKTGRTRATFEMTEDDSPTLKLFDKNGATTFKIQ